MTARKKKTKKSKKLSHFKGHYCKICGEHKANEKFSGKGHAAHICKSCASKSPAQKSEDMTMNKLHGMAFRYLSESEIKWLKNRRNDDRPEVRALACQVFEAKFPRQVRNEIKSGLHIKNILFYVRGGIWDSYGDEYYINVEFTADTSGKIIRKSFDENNAFIDEKTLEVGQKAIRKLFNVAVHKYDISFWNTDLCREISYDPDIDLLPEYLYGGDFDFDDLDDDEFENDGNKSDIFEAESSDASEDREPTWRVEIKYKNSTEQNIEGYDYIPDPVMSLFIDFEDYFEDEFSDDDLDRKTAW